MEKVNITRYSIGGLAVVIFLVLAAPAAATPNMIRLGYPTCASCHLSPSGGGLLTRYGEGIDLAQTLRPEEAKDPELGEDGLGSRLNYDARLTLGVDREPPSNAGYDFGLSFRSAIGIIPSHRLVYSASINSPTLQRTRTSGAVSMGMSRLYWLYQPKEGLQFVFGRDDLPSGIGSGPQSYFRRVNNPGVSSTPTQAKVYWWNNRWQVTAYGFGPAGNETSRELEARGGGAVVGANVWKDRAIVGLTTRVSRAEAFDRQNAGVFVRLGVSRHWGILAEHDITQRTVNTTGVDLTHVAGHTELFFVPFDWLQTSLAAQHVKTNGGTSQYRLSPSADVRLTSNIKLSFDVTDAGTDFSRTSRTYAFALQVKTQ
jgi:hypothetical protein